VGGEEVERVNEEWNGVTLVVCGVKVRSGNVCGVEQSWNDETTCFCLLSFQCELSKREHVVFVFVERHK